MASKTVAAPRNGLTPGECVGESIRSTPEQVTRTCIHDGGVMVDASNAQLFPAPLVVAYEPHRASGPLNPPRWTTSGGVPFIPPSLPPPPPPARPPVFFRRNAGPELLSRLGDTVTGLFPGRPRTTPPHLPQSSTRSPRRRKHGNDGGVPEACFWLTSPSPTLVSLADTVSATTDHRVRVLAALRRPAVAELDRVMLVKSSDLTRFDRGSLLP